MTTHWHAPPKPAITSIDLRIEAVVSPSPFSECLGNRASGGADIPVCWENRGTHGRQECLPHRDRKCGLNFEFPAVRVVSIPIAKPVVRVRSFVFPESPVASLERSPCPLRGGATAAADSRTRIKPPADVIKLVDRLQYVLQPSLESLLAEGALAFPVRPFPFQFEGAAFLYPRQAAILADEMGLGKTMQAITAMRLLLHRGQARSVLLVCPKPLVTNWQREFAVWAPEIPVMVVEGDQAKRHWQWQLPDAPLRIANYELLLRDRELLADRHFDLVVLDESQRIARFRAIATGR